MVYSFVDFSTNKSYFNEKESAKLQKRIDSLKIIEKENSKPKVYPFNPNYLTDYKAYQLGMSTIEIDRLLLFRKQGKFVNSAKDFQRITKVSDSLLNVISPYFKFPDWVVKQQAKKKAIEKVIERISISTTDLNLATVKDLQSINGVNKFLAERIVKYRDRIQGYTYAIQLFEVWNLDRPIAENILKTFQIKTLPIIQKVNVNSASFKQVLSNPYIDYELCKKIFNFRDEVAELQSIEELKNIQGFPLDKYDRIVLYLDAK